MRRYGGKMSPPSLTIEGCRICESPAIEPILDLGRQPLANSLRRDRTEVLPLFPLKICRCKACGTVQLTETVNPEILFGHYVWVTGTSEGARKYSHLFSERTVARTHTGRLFVLEVASNDGTFLRCFAERGDRVLGVDPAQNISATAREAGIPTIAEFFGLALAKRIVESEGQADVVMARNVLPHVADANDVVAGMAHCLSVEGVGVIEFHRADVILKELHYDSIYHEHLYFHSLHSIGQLLDRFGLTPFDVTTSQISGGSFVVYFSKSPRARTAALITALQKEEALGVGGAGPWQAFARRCERHRTLLRSLVQAKKAAGKRVIGYGASARSSTMLNFCGIDHRLLDVIVDRAPLKHGTYTPGTDIPIVAPERAFSLKPDVVLLLAWNFCDEILTQIRAEHGWTGEVILPLPGDPEVVEIA
ncbi:MAG: class I SAM-dependent methyltransferase [Deltaproteobacteria bacterium]|nr:class I SAM-dependent methyltransferase [Deltaproteobacteria bacterium]